MLMPVEASEEAEPSINREAASSSKGYDGPVAVTITLNKDNTIAKIVVGDADFNETPGIGSKAQDEEFTGQFIGKKVPLAEGDVDVISGATITSEAVIKAVNKAADLLISEVLREATSSSKGYDGTVSVTITLNEDDTIAKMEVGDTDFNETPGIGSKAQDEEFSGQFIGKKVPLAEGDVDVISGATITSEAVMKAVNKAADMLISEVLREATSSSKGYDGPVSVTITLNEDDTIAQIIIGDADFNETPGIGGRTQDEEFSVQFIGKKVPLAEGDVDVISGATITSEAVIKAVNKAADKLLQK
ncbi:MAG: FMN-binding protein [Clostridiales bacterium]|nr:FMN-binding protein [Clostridiales bacterium]